MGIVLCCATSFRDDEDVTEDEMWMRRALALSHLCPPSKTAFSVGAVVVRGLEELAAGFSRETDETIHAEESALSKLSGVDLAGATVYSTLEPCSRRASRPLSCSQLILRAGIRRVVFAYREPTLFVEGEGAELLTAAGVTVVEMPALADEVIEINSHLLL